MNEDIGWVVRLAIGVMFALSALGKLRDVRAFAFGVREYKILPERSAVPFAILVIVCEVCLAILHLAGWLLIFAVPLGLLLLCSFLVAVSINVVRRRNVPCYCFGTGNGEVISSRSLVRLGIAILGELLLLLGPSVFSGATTHVTTRRSPQDIVLALTWVCFILLTTMWMMSVPDIKRLIVSLRRPPLARRPTTSIGGSQS
jgi:hypothetical protein